MVDKWSDKACEGLGSVVPVLPALQVPVLSALSALAHPGSILFYETLVGIYQTVYNMALRHPCNMLFSNKHHGLIPRIFRTGTLSAF